MEEEARREAEERRGGGRGMGGIGSLAPHCRRIDARKIPGPGSFIVIIFISKRILT